MRSDPETKRKNPLWDADFQVAALATSGSLDDFRGCRRAHEGDRGGYCGPKAQASIQINELLA
jgi:hypothetical protein